MQISFFRRTATATALLLAACGMHVPLLAAAPVPAKRTATANHSELSPRAQRAGKAPKPASRVKTPFNRVMQPRIEAQHAKSQLARQLNALVDASTARPNSAPSVANGLDGNFPHFFHPSLIQTEFFGDHTYAPISMTADVNKDGKPDLITIQRGGRLDVVLNSGTGLAATASYHNDTQSSESYYIEWASAVDLNGDGYPDIEAVDSENQYAYIFLNNGSSAPGTFAAGVQLALPVPANYTIDDGYSDDFEGDVIFADVTGDGRPDLVILSGYYPQSNQTSISIQVLAGAGDGTFPSITQSQTQLLNQTVEGSYHCLQVADVNGDQNADLVFPAYVPAPYSVLPGVTPRLPSTDFFYTYVLTGNNLGIFSPFAATDSNSPGAYAVGQEDFPFASYVGNVGNNSTPGVVVVGNSGVYTQLSNSDGTLQPAVNSPIDSYNSTTQNVADVTGDGIVDLVSYSDGFISIYPGVGDGTFNPTASAQYIASEVNYQQAMPADFNGDGIVDLVATHEYGSAAVYQGLGGGLFIGAPLVAPANDIAYNYADILTDNLAGQGFADVLLYDYLGEGSALVTAANDGKGNFTYKTAIDGGTYYAANISFVEPVSLDINNDGHPDLLMVATNGLFEALNNGDGTFAAPVQISLPNGDLSCDLNYAVVGDINNDGKKDIVVAFAGCGGGGTTDSGFFTLLNNGDGTFTSSFTPYGDALYKLGLGDLNNDGNLDLLVDDCPDGCQLTAIPGAGDGTFITPNDVGIYEASDIFDFVASDINGDGKADLIVATDDTPGAFGVATLVGNGDLSFTNYQATSFGFFPYGIALTDFNGDGKPDLVASGYADFTYYYEGLAYMANLGNGSFSNPVLLPSVYGNKYPLGNSTLVMVGDFNSDGAQDFLGTSSNVPGIFYNTGGIALALTTSATTAEQGSPVTLTSTLTPTFAGPQATGTVTYYDNNAVIGAVPVANNVAALTLSTLSVGANAITAVYSGDVNYNTKTSTASVNSTISVTALGTVSLAVSASTTTPTQDTPVTLTATLTISGGSGTPTGTVTFYDNGTAVGIVPVTSTTVTLTVPSLPLGSNIITAVYSGDATYSTATSTANVNSTLTVTPLAAAFTMATVSGGTLDLTVGQTGVATFMVTANPTFNGPITLACSGAPAGTSCTLSPGTLTLSGAQSGTFTAVLDTTAPNNHFNATNSFPTWLKTTGGITLAGGLLLLWPNRRRRNLWTLMLLGTLALGGMATLTGCDHKYSGTPAGTYNVTVSATAGSIVQTGTIALTLHK